MCICDGKYFKVVNTTTGRTKLYKRAASIAKRFGSSRDWIFYCTNHSGVHLHRNGEKFSVEVNRHTECERDRCETFRRHGVRLWNIPARYRHMLQTKRR